MSMFARVAAAHAGLVTAGAGWYFLTRDNASPGRQESNSRASEAATVERVLRGANSIVSACRCLGFVCMQQGTGGVPECRVMDLHRLSDETLEFGLVSRRFTRKAATFAERPGCTLAFHDPRAAGEAGYLVLSGDTREVVSPEERGACWKPSWSFFHPGPEAPSVVQWRFVPRRLELVSNLHGLTDDWAPVTALREVDRPGAPWLLQERRGRRECSEG